MLKNMRFEIPECRRCCFCVPLRYGLLVWSYLILVPLGLTLFAQIIDFINIRFYMKYHGWTIIIRLTCFVILLIVNIAFSFLLIVAAHMKSSKLLKIYNKCALITSIINLVALISDLIYVCAMYGAFIFLLAFITFFFMRLLFIGMQIYILVLVRSEIIKLENNIGFEFHNVGAEAEKDYYEPETVLIVHDKKDGIQQTEEKQPQIVTDM